MCLASNWHNTNPDLYLTHTHTHTHSGVGILLLGIALLFVSVAFGVTVATSQQGSGGNPTVDDVCVTPSCVKLAASILSSMNESVNPCQDFYNFTCGGWDDDNIVPPGKQYNHVCKRVRGLSVFIKYLYF